MGDFRALQALSRTCLTFRPMPAIPTDQVLWTTREAAEVLRVAPSTIRRWCKEGTLDSVPLSPYTWRVRAASVVALIDPAGEGAGVDQVPSAARNGGPPQSQSTMEVSAPC